MPERNTIGGHTSSIGAAYTDAGISASFFLILRFIINVLILNFHFRIITKITIQVFTPAPEAIFIIEIPTLGSPFVLCDNLIHRAFMDKKVSDF